MSSFGPIWLGVVIAAVITAIVTAIGWLVTHAREIALRSRERREKIIDVQEAFRAEIRSHIRELDEDRTRGGGYRPRLKALGETLAENPKFKPIVPQEKHDSVFDALKTEIHLLPTDVVEPVVAYYAKLATLSALLDDLRRGPLRDLEGDRLLEAFRDMSRLKLRTLELAKEADAALTTGIGKLARPAPWINTTARGPQEG